METQYGVVDRYGIFFAHDMSLTSALSTANFMNSSDPDRGWTIVVESVR